MIKFSHLMLAAAAMAPLAGCMAESQDATAEQGSNESAAVVCSNNDGTNAMIASLAVAIGSELHRWQVGKDFYIYRGYNYQEMLGLTSTGLAQCSNGCRNVKAILSFQDSRTDQTLEFPGGQKLNAWTYASRLTAGFKNQQTCDSRPDNHKADNCPAEAHKLVLTGLVKGGCDTMATYNATTAAGGALMYPAQLKNKLLWANDQGQVNPYIAFSSTGTTVSIDPIGNTIPPRPAPPAPGSCWDGCSMYSETNIAADCCSCNGKTGKFKIDQLNPDTYKCK